MKVKTYKVTIEVELTQRQKHIVEAKSPNEAFLAIEAALKENKLAANFIKGSKPLMGTDSLYTFLNNYIIESVEEVENES